MLDLTVYKKQYYQVKLNENEVINLETPKKKQLKTLLSLTKEAENNKLTDETLDKLYEAASIAFNKNKEGKKFTEEQIEEMFGINALYAFFDGYYTWVSENINQKN